MNNFMVIIKGSERLNNEIKTVFAKNFVEQKNYENELNEKKNIKYILTKQYVDNYISPFLIKEGDFYCVLCEINLLSLNSKNNESFNDVLNLEFYSSNIYFEGMEKDQYEIKTNKQNKEYKEYNIKNKSVLLLYGDFNYINKNKRKKEKERNEMKELYYYIQENKHNLYDCFNNIEGSFILIYVQYENSKVNFFFFNDQFGKKSFIYSYVNDSIILTNMCGFFINYDFNYICINEENYLFDDNSIKEEFNLIDHQDFFYRESSTNNEPCNIYKNFKIKNKNINSINEKIAVNITPHYIYHLLIERNNVILKNLKKENCIYNNYNVWNNRKLSLKENFQYILNFFQQNNFYDDFNKEEQNYLKETIENLINKKMNHEKKEEIEYQEVHRQVIKEDIFTETKLNNIFINLYITLLNNIVKKKIEELFEDNTESENEKIEYEKNMNDFFKDNKKENLKENKKKKSIGIFFSGGIDSTLLAIVTIKNFFRYYKNGYIELINVVFNENAVDRYTALISYERLINLFPFYDIRLVFIDVTTMDLVKYEKIIYSLISPNSTTMDYNISSALFFANIGRGYICSPTFFKSKEWHLIKKSAINILNINYNMKNDKNNLNENEENKKNNIKNKCNVCEFVMKKKCIHRCCSSCCRKLRYIYFNEFFLNEKQEIKNENLTILNKNESNNNMNFHKEESKSFIDIYEVTYDEKTNKKYIYLLIKKKKILIDFEIYFECNIHKDKLYDYKKIGTLFYEFNKELEKKKKYEIKNFKVDLDEKHKDYYTRDLHKRIFDEFTSTEQNENNKTNEIEKDKVHEIVQEDKGDKVIEDETVKNIKENYIDGLLSDVSNHKVGADDFIEYFVAKKSNKDTDNFHKIKNLFCVNKKREKRKSNNKNEDRLFIDNPFKKEKECLNFLNRKLYNLNNQEKEKYYECSHRLLIIGSGADELFGGYYRQNNSNTDASLDPNFKMNEMVKDIKRLWIRNLYRDDRIISFTSSSKKHIFYPFLSINLVNFLLLLPFNIIELPIPNFYYSENKMDNEKKKKSSLLYTDSIFEICKKTENEKRIKEDTGHNTNFSYLMEDLEECYQLYEIMKNNKISKWILRMAIYFLKVKEVMFFKKKAIQFGSKAKDIRKYIKESLYSCNSEGNVISDKKGDDYYTILS